MAVVVVEVVAVEGKKKRKGVATYLRRGYVFLVVVVEGLCGGRTSLPACRRRVGPARARRRLAEARGMAFDMPEEGKKKKDRNGDVPMDSWPRRWRRCCLLSCRPGLSSWRACVAALPARHRCCRREGVGCRLEGLCGRVSSSHHMGKGE